VLLCAGVCKAEAAGACRQGKKHALLSERC
jgi:hypothetical protein